MVVFVESAVLSDQFLRLNQAFFAIKDKLRTFSEDLTDKIDFIICLGGDGTLLYASSLFQVNRVAISCQKQMPRVERPVDGLSWAHFLTSDMIPVSPMSTFSNACLR